MNCKTTSKSTVTRQKVSGLAAQTINNKTPECSKKITPKVLRNSIENETNVYSPFLSQFSQEEFENLDVIWDWNSPQSKTRPLKHKKLDFPRSPEVVFKRHPSNKQMNDILKLKSELETFKDDICKNQVPSVSHLNDVFDDSMEAQLLQCSQNIEEQALTTLSFSNCTTSTTNIKKTSVASVTHLEDTLGLFDNDSFELLLGNIKEQDSSNHTECTSSKINNRCDETTFIDEIERKRLDAITKLELKKKPPSYEDDSPIKCSPEEIEQKRLKAVAKREEKKKLAEIERKRLEAVKRRELNKKKRAIDNSTIVLSIN